MWIERLEIEGFRGLAGTYEFSQGLTVVVGDNESGKSSLHDALVRTLFGYSKTERRRSKGSSPLERRAPWNGTPYRLVGFVRKDDRQFRIEWDFAVHRVRLLDELGHDISGSVMAKGDEVELGEYLLGIDLDDFRQVCCIDQDGLMAVRHSPSLGVALQEAVANIAGETPVENALARLNDFLRTAVGARVDNLNPSPKGRLADLSRQRAGIQTQLEAAEKAREELVAISREHAKARDEHDALLTAHEGMKQRHLVGELRRLGEQLAEARRLDAAARDRPEAGQALEETAVDAVKAAIDSLSELKAQTARAEAETSAVADSVSRLESEQRELIAAVDGLAPYADVDVSARDRVQTASAQLVSLDSPEEAARAEVPAPDPMLVRYRAERESLLALAGERAARWSLRRFLWVVLVVLTLGIAWSIRWVVRRLRGARPGSLEERLAAYNGASLDELDARVAEEDRRAAVAEGVVAALAASKVAAEDQREGLVEQLGTALDAVSAPPAPLDERARAYLIAVERHNERTEKEAALGRIQQELSSARRPQDELERLRRDVVRAEHRLRDAYRTLGIDSDELESAEREFDSALGLGAAERQREHDAEAAATALRSILSGDSLETLSARVAEAQRLVNAHQEIHGDLVGEFVSDTAERVDLDAEVRTHVQRVAELETRAKQLEEEAGDPATLKERLALIDSQVDRLNEAKNAVAIAREVLSEAAVELRREFAPHLNAALKHSLSRITNGRYAEAMVNAELTVQVVVPETGKLQPADELSRATKDQVFLVQRLEIARLLAPTKGKAPLLLDDPFAHYDRQRLRPGLEVVAEAAEERQIIVFSEDPELADIARQACATCQVIELARPLAKVAG